MPAPQAPDVVPETLIKLTVDAMPAPKPALRYLLLPELREQTQGNPIPNYLKCILDQDLSTPQEETLGRAALKQADRAARMDKPDWQLLPKLKTDGFGLLLPDLQKMRRSHQHSRADSATKSRYETFDDVFVTAKTDVRPVTPHERTPNAHRRQFRWLSPSRTVAIAPLEEMLEQPGCPNLHWALDKPPSARSSRWTRAWKVSGV